MIEVQLPPTQFYTAEDVTRAIAAAVVGLSSDPDRELSGRELVRLAAVRINWAERVEAAYNRGALAGRNPMSLERLPHAVMHVDQVVFSVTDLNACTELRDGLLHFVVGSSQAAVSAGNMPTARRRWTEAEIEAARAIRDKHRSTGRRDYMTLTALHYRVKPQWLRKLFAKKPTASFAAGLGGRKS